MNDFYSKFIAARLAIICAVLDARCPSFGTRTRGAASSSTSSRLEAECAARRVG
jgi:hypothetical protein